MKTYNDLINYNEVLVTYNGIVIVISETLVVNSETVSTLEIINVPPFGDGEIGIINGANFAVSTLLSHVAADGVLDIQLDKANQHAIIDMGKVIDHGPEGLFSITIISNI